MMDIFKMVVPRIAMVNRNIFANYAAAPQFLFTGLKTSAVLESLQQIAVNMQGVQQGEYGFSADAVAFSKQTILYSPAMDDSKIYLVYKAPADVLSRSVIIDLVYKPLYIIEEITNSQKRTFVKSRTAVEVCDTRALGLVSLTGLTDIFGA